MSVVMALVSTTLIFGSLVTPIIGASLKALKISENQPRDKPIQKAFPHSTKCKRCHSRAYDEWEASAQSRSIQSAAFRVTMEHFLKSAPKSKQTMCFQCHAPHILEYGHLSKQFLKEVRSRDPQIDGVGCTQCHLISDVDLDRSPPQPQYHLGRTVFGGYEHAAENLAHQSQQLDLYKQSQYCVTCHEALPETRFANPSSGWLGDWRNAQAQQTDGTRSCQDCHMPKAMGESANGERSRQTANHRFPGRFGKVPGQTVDLQFTTKVDGQQSSVQVGIKSLVPHHLPLPHPGWSRLELTLTIRGKNLKKVYEAHRFFERVYLDAQDRETVFDFDATKIARDTLLKPHEERTEHFHFPTPADAPSMDVIVTLSYAPMHGPDEFLKAVEADAPLGRKDRAFQRVPIAQLKQNVVLTKKS